jgi:protein-disulfide isomerase
MTYRKWNLSLGLSLIVLLLAPHLRAQEVSTDDLRKEIQELSQTVRAMQKDLQEIKALLQSRAQAVPSQNVVLDLGKNPSQGDPEAKLTLIEFSDYQCPYCAKYFRETAPQIEQEYIKTGKLKHVFMDFPLESIHKLAFKAAEAANCAGEQGKYWEMHNQLFANQQKLEPWTAHAQSVGLDLVKFEECLDSGRQATEIRSNMAEGQKAGVTGTPAFFLAYTDAKSSKVNTIARLSGSQPFSVFKSAIDKLLAAQSDANK